MARDSVTVDFLLNTRKADKDLARIRKEMERLGAASGKALKGFGGAGGEKVRALGTGLSKATVRADEFTKSLEASNARVVAFGASAGIIMQIDRAFKAMVASTIKVEKALLDVNVVLNATQKNLKQFGVGMFQISKQTAQGFDVVSEAATELARQGLGMEKTLTRTKDALILTRLTGMNAADAVKSLTAAVNSFNKEGVTSAQVINKMAKVDAAFAVSSEDLAKAISRVGASAVSAGVSMDELLAITTAVQQRTARGGAVIGNAFKTIFTRIQRTDVLQKLRNIGVAVTDMQGNMLSGIQVIQNLANNFDSLSKSQQASVSESVAGVFQVNILKAAMADLSSATSNYNRALKVSNSATNEAYRRNEELNKSLDALVNRTLANLTQAGASIGGATLEPAIRKTLNFVNDAIESFGKGGALEGFGQTVGKSILEGIGRFMSGPGIAGITATVGVLFYKLSKFTTKAFADIMGINKASQQRAALEDAIVKTMASEPQLLQQVLNKTVSISQVEQQILNTIRRQNLERAAAQTIAGPVSGGLLRRGARVGRGGGVSIPGSASGFIPNFSNPNAERAAAAAGGYRAGAIKTMNQPGRGSVMYNSAETVKRFPGMSQSAIMPPQNSAAGAGYKAAFGAAHGFNPYAAAGLVPNFLKKPTRDLAVGKKVSGRKIKEISLTGPGGKGKKDIGVLLAEGSTSTAISYKNKMSQIPYLRPALAGSPAGAKLLTGELGARLTPDTLFTSYGIPAVSMFPMSMQQAKEHVDGSIATSSLGGLQKALNRYKDQVGAKLLGKFAKGQGKDFNVDALSKGTEGDIFEEAVRAASEGTVIKRQAAFDFDGADYAPKKLMDFMIREGAPLSKDKSKVEAKIGNEAAISGNIPKKIVNDLLDDQGQNVGYYKSLKGLIQGIKGQAGLRGKAAALGFIPNFNPLSQAIGREMAGGVPSSSIRIGSHKSLRSPSNPAGVGVYNTVHEPGGLIQGISRARSQGINPQGHGIPNYRRIPLPTGRPRLPLPGDRSRAPTSRDSKKNTEATQKQTESTNELSGEMEKLTAAMAANAQGGSVGKGLGLAMVAPQVIAEISRGTGFGQDGGLGGAVMGATSSAASWGGMGMMFGPKVGLAAGIAGGIFGGITGAMGQASDAVEELAEKMTELTKRNDRAAETFTRIADEMDKINKAGGDTAAIEKQRNELLLFIKQNYGGDEAYSDVFRDVGGVSTGKRVREIRERTGQIFTSQEASKRFQKAILGEEIKEKGRIRVGENAFFVSPQMLDGLSPIRGGSDPGRGDALFQRGVVGERITPGTYDANHPLFKRLKGTTGLGISDMEAALAGQLADSFSLDNLSRVGSGNLLNATIGDVRPLITKRGSIANLASIITGGETRTGGRSLISELSDAGSIMGRDSYKGRNFTRTFFDRSTGAMKLSGERQRLRLGMADAAVMGGEKGEAAAAQAIALLSGLDEEGTADLKKTLLDRARKAAEVDGSAGGANDFSTMDALQELANEALETSLSFGELDRILGLREEGETARVQQIKKEIDIQDKRVEAFRSEIAALDQLSKQAIVAAAGLRHTAAMAKLQTSFNNRLAGVKGQGRLARARAIGDPFDVAQATRDVAQANESVRFKGARTDAKATFTKAIGEIQLGAVTKTIDAVFKEALEGDVGLSEDVIAERRKDVEKVIKDITATGKLGTLTPEDIKKFEETLKNLGGLAAGEGGKRSIKLSDVQQDELERVQALLGTFRKLQVDFQNQQVQLKQQNTNNKKIIEEKFEIDKQEIKNRFEFNTKLRDFNEEVAMVLADLKAREAGSRMASGRITGAQGAALFKNRMETRRTKQGLGPIRDEMDASIRQGFRGELTYNARSYLDDLEEGSKQFASTLKTSFSDAFRNIASGAMDAKSAIAQFADSILNTISDVTARIGTNMLFSRMGFGEGMYSQGGLVPRYNAGGVVTGGSGYKDDVLTMMNGGEFVIKKSAAQKIGYGTLNAINSGGIPRYNEGGGVGGMGSMFAISAGASAVSGWMNQTGQGKEKPWRGQDYGHGRGAYGYFGGPDVNATGASSVAGSSQSAAISLSKGFNFYRRDPATGRLISERARPTEGGYDVSSALSLAGRLNSDDPQTSRMFQREEAMGSYQDYLATETQSRKDQIRAHERKKRGRLISAYANAAMLIGGAYFFGRNTGTTGGGGKPSITDPNYVTPVPSRPVGDAGVPISRGISESAYDTDPWRGAAGGSPQSSPALLMGGEYVMSPDTVRTHGLGFMNELNRGNVPGYANGGLVGGTAVGGGINNNISINVNVDKRGNASVDASQGSTNAVSQNATQEAEKNKQLGAALQTVVVQEIIKQQRPGGLLQNTNKFGAV